MKAPEVTLDKIEEGLKAILVKRFPNDYERQRILLRVDRFNFCCPYCGDSAQSSKKKRGNFYPSTLHYVCYNGGCEKHADLVKMMKDFSVDVFSSEEMTAAKLKIMETKENMRVDRLRRQELSLEALTNTDFTNILVQRKDLLEKLNLIDVHPKSFMGIYLNKRQQFIDERYAWEPRKKKLFIFNTDKTGQWVFALQMRQFDRADSKYLTYNLSGVLSKLMGVVDEDRLTKARAMDHISTVFNVLKINFNETVTVFEGPLDSFLFHNSVGMCSINNDWPFDVDNYRLFQDNDEAGRKKALALIEKGKPVFLWRKLIDEHSLHDKKIKDYNDLVTYCRANGLKIDNIEKYFSSHRYDGIFL